MEQISATLITFNEEINIVEALESVSWADETVVVDSGSTDATLQLCRRFTDKIHHREWTGYADQKNFAAQQAKHDWIFSVDADERASPELVREIQELRRTSSSKAGYRIPRVAFFMGRWIRHGDWYPDHQLRLYDRTRGTWGGGRVHESVQLRGEAGQLAGEIHHYTYRTLSEYLARLDTYSTLAAADYRQRGKSSGPSTLLGHPFAAFVRAYFLKRGFLDATPGLMVAVMGAISVYFKYAKLYELQCGSGIGKAHDFLG